MKKVNYQLQKQQLINNSSNSTKWMYWLLALLTFFIYANSINNGYNLDDEIVTNNHPLTSQGIKAIGEIFTSPYYKDDMGYAYGYRPIVHVSYAIEHELFAEKPQISHFFNVLLYVLSVLLFFRLLHRLFGEKYTSLIFITALFFAVHPVHTEVVASLKNRDELLGFLFAMASGNWLVIFIQKSKSNWLELILSIVFFLLALLSKKSVYPLVFVFPLAISLFTSVSCRTFHTLLIALVIPAALMTSELNINRFLMLSFVPITFGTLSFYILGLLKEKSLKALVVELTQNKYFLIGSIILILVLTTYLKTQWLTFMSIPFFFLLIRHQRILGVVIFSLSCLLLSFLFSQSEYALLALIFPAFMLFQQLKEKSLNKQLVLFNILVLVIAITLETYQGGVDFGIFSRYFALYFFLFIRNYKSWLAIVFVPLAISVAHFVFGAFENGQVNFFLVSLAIIAAYDALATIKKTEFYNTLLIILCVIGFAIPLLQQYRSLPVQNTNNKVLKVEINQSDVQNQGEGRALDYVENTLVATHSDSETIATGFSTLGEYFRLMVFPNELSFYYGYSKIKTTNFSDGKVWLIVIIHFGLIVLAFWKIRQQSFISFGIFWYLLSILLFSNWFELVAGMVGERLAFTASAGFSIFVGSILIWIKPGFNLKKPQYLESSVIIILFLFTLKSIQRNSEWKDQLTLMGSDIKHLQNSAQANNLFALNLMKISTTEESYSLEQRYEMQKRAVSHFKRATEIYPKFKNAWFDLGRAAWIINDTSLAIKSFSKSIKLNPTFNLSYDELLTILEITNNKEMHLFYARRYFHVNKEPKVYIVYAKSLFANDKKKEAITIIEKGIQMFPSDVELKKIYK